MGKVSGITQGAKSSDLKLLKSVMGDIGRDLRKNAADAATFEKNLSKALSVSQKVFSPTGAGSLEAWRKSLPAPNVTIADAMAKGFTGAGGNPMQGGAGGLTGGLATAGQGLPQTEKEMAADKALRIKKEAVETRRKDLMEADAKKAMMDRASFYKNMTFLMMPLFNPGSIWATLFSTRQTFSALNTNKGQEELGKFGLGGLKGSAIGTGALVAISTALGFALKGLKMAVEETIAAYDKARILYAKSLMSGLGLEQTSRRTMMASIIGVSEKDIMQFGSALAFLNPKLSEAAKIYAQTATPLTETAYRFKILKEDLGALFAQIAANLSPAIMRVIDLIDNLVKSFTNFANSDLFQKMLKGQSMMFNAMFHDLFPFAKRGAALADKSLGSHLGLPESHMRQLPASSFERMGLIVSGMGGQHYAKDTAQNTKEIAAGIKIIVGNMRSGGLPRGFGMDGYTSNP